MPERTFIAQTLVTQAAYARDQYAQRGALTVSTKRDANDLLTQADLAIQAAIVDGIRSAFPGDYIVGEEDGLNVLPEDTHGRCWFIDPIDGTQNFVRGLYPAYGISIGFADQGRAQAGGVALPQNGTAFLAQRGSGATQNGETMRVSSVASLDRARVEIDFGHPHSRATLLHHTKPIMERAGQVRCHCAAVVGICSVATGDADAFIHPGLTPWDFAAAVLIAEEAGARATQFDGTAVPLYAEAPSLVVSNGRIHDEILDTLHSG
jgi:myo-inositol-1(or 4)-monophosphatase